MARTRGPVFTEHVSPRTLQCTSPDLTDLTPTVPYVKELHTIYNKVLIVSNKK